MLETNRSALKEWAVIVRQLGNGDQVVLIRKGGILEQKHGFSVRHREFFLFPTYVHQKEEELIPRIREELARVVRASPPLEDVWLDHYAVVEEVFEVRQLAPLRRLEGLHAFDWSAVESRFQYRRPGLHVLVLRVYGLPKTVKIPNAPRYNGCISWVELDVELSTHWATPVLPDADFAEKLGAARAALVVSAVP